MIVIMRVKGGGGHNAIVLTNQHNLLCKSPSFKALIYCQCFLPNSSQIAPSRFGNLVFLTSLLLSLLLAKFPYVEL